MAVKAVNLATTIRVVHDDDPAKGTPDETVFLVSPLTSWQNALVQDMIASLDGGVNDQGQPTVGSMKLNAAALVATQLSLRGWENFIDHQDNDIPFNTVKKNFGGRTCLVIAPELLDILPGGLALQIFKAAMDAAAPSEQAAKNL